MYHKKQSRLQQLISMVIIVAFMMTNVLGVVTAQTLDMLSGDYREYLDRLEMYGSDRMAWEEHANSWISGVSKWEGAYEREEIESALTGIREEVAKEREKEEILSRIGRWNDLYEYVEGANRDYLYRRKEEGAEELEIDSEGNLQMRGSEDLATDLVQWGTEIGRGIVEEQRKYEERLRAEAAARGIELSAAEYGEIVGVYARELEEIRKYEEQKFITKRKVDSYSLRKQVSAEAASAEVTRIIARVEEEVEGVASGEEVELEEMEVGEEVWIEEYQEKYERGMQQWREGIERMMESWGAWEVENVERIREGRSEWMRGYARLQEKREEWEEKMREEYRRGKAAYTARQDELAGAWGREEELYRLQEESLRKKYETAIEFLIGSEGKGYYYGIQARKKEAESMMEYWKDRGEEEERSGWEGLKREYEEEEEKVIRQVQQLYEEVVGGEAGSIETMFREAGAEYGGSYHREVRIAREEEEAARERYEGSKRVLSEVEDYTSGKIGASELYAKITEAGLEVTVAKAKYEEQLALIASGREALEEVRVRVRAKEEAVEKMQDELRVLEEELAQEKRLVGLERRDMISIISRLNEEAAASVGAAGERLRTILELELLLEERRVREGKEKYIEEYVPAEDSARVREYMQAESEGSWIIGQGVAIAEGVKESEVGTWVRSAAGKKYYAVARVKSILDRIRGVSGMEAARAILESAEEKLNRGEAEREIAIGGSEVSGVLEDIMLGKDSIRGLGEYGEKEASYNQWERVRAILDRYAGLRDGVHWEESIAAAEGVIGEYGRGEKSEDEYETLMREIMRGAGSSARQVIQMLYTAAEKRAVLEVRERGGAIVAEEISGETWEWSRGIGAEVEIVLEERSRYQGMGDKIGELVSGMKLAMIEGNGVEVYEEMLGRRLYGSEESISERLSMYGITEESGNGLIITRVEAAAEKWREVLAYTSGGSVAGKEKELGEYYEYRGREGVGRYLVSRIRGGTGREEVAAVEEIGLEMELIGASGTEVGQWIAGMARIESEGITTVSGMLSALGMQGDIIGEIWNDLDRAEREKLYDEYDAWIGSGEMSYARWIVEKGKEAEDRLRQGEEAILGTHTARKRAFERKLRDQRKQEYYDTITSKETRGVIHRKSYAEYRSAEELKSGEEAYDFREVKKYGIEARDEVEARIGALGEIWRGVSRVVTEKRSAEIEQEIAKLSEVAATEAQADTERETEQETYNTEIHRIVTERQGEKLREKRSSVAGLQTRIESATREYRILLEESQEVERLMREREAGGEAARKTYQRKLRVNEEYEILRRTEASIYLGEEEVREQVESRRRLYVMSTTKRDALERIASERKDVLAEDAEYREEQAEYERLYREEYKKGQVVSAVIAEVEGIKAEKAEKERAIAIQVRDILGVEGMYDTGGSVSASEMEGFIEWLVKTGSTSVMQRWGKSRWEEKKEASGEGREYIDEYTKEDSIMGGVDDSHYNPEEVANEMLLDRAGALALVLGNAEERKWYGMYKDYMESTGVGKMHKALDWSAESEYYQRIQVKLGKSEQGFRSKEITYRASGASLVALGSILSIMGFGGAIVAAGVSLLALSEVNRVEKEQSAEMKRQVGLISYSQERARQDEDVSSVSGLMTALWNSIKEVQAMRNELALLGIYDQGLGAEKYVEVGSEELSEKIHRFMGVRGAAITGVGNGAGIGSAVAALYTGMGAARGENIITILTEEQRKIREQREGGAARIATHIATEYHDGAGQEKTAVEYRAVRVSYAAAMRGATGLEEERALGVAYQAAVRDIYEKSYDGMSRRIREKESYLKLWKEMEAGSIGEKELIEDIRAGILRGISEAAGEKRAYRYRVYEEARARITEEEAAYDTSYAALVEKSEGAWRRAAQKYLAAHRSWEAEVSSEYREAQREWESRYTGMQAAVEEWGSELVAALASGIYDDRGDEEQMIAQDIAVYQARMTAVAKEVAVEDTLRAVVGEELESYISRAQELNEKIGGERYVGDIITSRRTSPQVAQTQLIRAGVSRLEKKYRAGLMRQIAYERRRALEQSRAEIDDKITRSNKYQEHALHTFFDDKGYQIGTDSYQKRVVSETFAFSTDYRTITIDHYQWYELDAELSEKLEIEIEEDRAESEEYYASRIAMIGENIAYVNRAVFGREEDNAADAGTQVEGLAGTGIAYEYDAEEGELLEGLYAIHVGSVATVNAEGSAVSDEGSGELGRIFTAYYTNYIEESEDWGKYQTAFHRRKMFDLDTENWDLDALDKAMDYLTGPWAYLLKETTGFDLADLFSKQIQSLGKASVLDAASVAATVGATIAGGIAGGQVWLGAAVGLALSTAVNGGATIADIESGSDVGDSWESFGKQLAIDSATTLISGGLGSGARALSKSMSKGVGGGIARSFGVGMKKAAVEAGSTVVEDTLSRYVSAGLSAGMNGEDVLDALEEQYETDKSSGGLGVITVDQLISAGAQVLGGGISGAGNRYASGKLLSGSNGLSEFAGSLVEASVDYAGRRVASGLSDGWDNWEGRGFQVGFLTGKLRKRGDRFDLIGAEIGGSDGFRMNAGETSLVRAGRSTVREVSAGYTQLKKSYGVRNSKSSFDQKNRDVILAGMSSGGTTERLLEEIRSGKTGLEVDRMMQGVAKTEQGLTGKRVIVGDGIGSRSMDGTVVLGKSRKEQLQALLVLAHEGKRDGVVRSDNEAETKSAVRAHMSMAQRIMGEYGNGVFAGTAMGKNIADDFRAEAMGADQFDAYVRAHYESSQDYWKYDQEGNLQYDGDGWLKNERGEYVHNEVTPYEKMEEGVLKVSKELDKTEAIGDDDPVKGLSQILNQHATGAERERFDEAAAKMVQEMQDTCGTQAGACSIDAKELIEKYMSSVAFPILEQFSNMQELHQSDSDGSGILSQEMQGKLEKTKTMRGKLLKMYHAYKHDTSLIYAPDHYKRLAQIDATRPEATIKEVRKNTQVKEKISEERGGREVPLKRTILTFYNASQYGFEDSIYFRNTADSDTGILTYKSIFNVKPALNQAINPPQGTDIMRSQWLGFTEAEGKEGYLPRYFIHDGVENEKTIEVMEKHHEDMRSKDEFIQEILLETDNGRFSERVANEMGLDVKDVFMDSYVRDIQNPNPLNLLMELTLKEDAKAPFSNPLPPRGKTKEKLLEQYGPHPYD